MSSRDRDILDLVASKQFRGPDWTTVILSHSIPTNKCIEPSLRLAKDAQSNDE